jgi:hypothetical protein
MPASHRKAQRAKRAIAEALTNAPKSEFTTEMLQSMSDALKSGRMKVEMVTFTDDVKPGLRAIVRQIGTVTRALRFQRLATDPESRRFGRDYCRVSTRVGQDNSRGG